MFLCKAFKEIIKENSKVKLVIAGDGEEEDEIKNFISENNLKNNIILLGYIDNIYPYFKNSKGFILSSLWEDPGFVLSRSFLLSNSNYNIKSWPGPVELIRNDFKWNSF